MTLLAVHNSASLDQWQASKCACNLQHQLLQKLDSPSMPKQQQSKPHRIRRCPSDKPRQHCKTELALLVLLQGPCMLQAHCQQ